MPVPKDLAHVKGIKAKLDRCAKKVKARGGSVNPWAVCITALRKRYGKKSTEGKAMDSVEAPIAELFGFGKPDPAKLAVRRREIVNDVLGRLTDTRADLVNLARKNKVDGILRAWLLSADQSIMGVINSLTQRARGKIPTQSPSSHFVMGVESVDQSFQDMINGILLEQETSSGPPESRSSRLRRRAGEIGAKIARGARKAGRVGYTAARVATYLPRKAIRHQTRGFRRAYKAAKVLSAPIRSRVGSAIQRGARRVAGASARFAAKRVVKRLAK